MSKISNAELEMILSYGINKKKIKTKKSLPKKADKKAQYRI